MQVIGDDVGFESASRPRAIFHWYDTNLHNNSNRMGRIAVDKTTTIDDHRHFYTEGTPMLLTRSLAIAVAGMLATAGTVFAAPLELVIKTEIREKTAAFQVGVKSIQTIAIDFDAQTISSVVTTGTTDIGVADLKSVRDSFSVANASFAGQTVSFNATGETASGVLVMPNINYALRLDIDLNARTARVSGCHDGYPSYEVSVSGSQVYSFEQEYLLALFGSCDTQVDISSAF